MIRISGRSTFFLALCIASLAAQAPAQVIKAPSIALPIGGTTVSATPQLGASPSFSPAPGISISIAAPDLALPESPIFQAAPSAEAPVPTAIESLKAVGAVLDASESTGQSERNAATLSHFYGETPRGGDVPAASMPGASAPRSFLAPAGSGGKLGVDTSAMDKSVRPQDDFFRYVSGTWLKDFKMPADKSRFGVFDELAEKSDTAVKTIIEESAAKSNVLGTPSQKIADLYKSFMNTDEIEKRGLSPIKDDLERIDQISAKEQLPGVFARAMKHGVGVPIGLSVDQDPKNTSVYIASIGQAGLGLPDRDYYFNTDESSVKIREKYVEYLTKIFTLAGEKDAAQKAATVFAVEKSLAEHQWTRVENRDPDKTHNKKAAAEINKLGEGFDFAAYLKAAKVPGAEKDVIVGQPSYMAGMAKVMSQTPLDSWKLYMKARTLDGAAGYLPDAFVQASFDFHGRTLSGQPEMRPRWKRGVSLVNGATGELVGQIYVQKHFPESSKLKMARMIENLRAAYAERISDLDWMREETKKKALEKLAKFTPKIGYPDKWIDYSKLEARPDDLMGNVRRSNLFDYDRMMAKLGKPVDRGEWFMTPQTVNAYYNPVMNEIVFPAAILQGAFFNPEADDAVNYGAIGAVIGHEMSHGFDDEGSKFDGDGMLKDWWTAKDREEFEARTKKLVDQFSSYEPIPGKHVNGALTLGENIGDLGGITVAFQAYRRSLNGATPPVIEGFTGDQRFFLGWAQVWRLAEREKALEQQIATDPHSPAEYRVNGVMPNVEGFYKAFELKEGDKLFTPEKDRVKIW